MLVITRYHVAATISSGMGWKITPEMSRARPYNSRLKGTAVTSDVVFSMLMNSLPVGGMMTRIACGNTVRRIVIDRDMLRAVDASDCPSGTELMPARMISAMYAASLRPRPMNARVKLMDRSCRLRWKNDGPNGMPSWMFLYSVGISPQNTSCTYTGVPRKIQRYTQDTDLNTGLGESRMTASSTPNATASTIDSTVSWMVTQPPDEIRWSNRYLR